MTHGLGLTPQLVPWRRSLTTGSVWDVGVPLEKGMTTAVVTTHRFYLVWWGINRLPKKRRQLGILENSDATNVVSFREVSSGKSANAGRFVILL